MQRPALHLTRCCQHCGAAAAGLQRLRCSEGAPPSCTQHGLGPAGNGGRHKGAVLLCLTIGSLGCQQCYLLQGASAQSAKIKHVLPHACLLLQEKEQRERAKRANLETRQANEVLQKFKQLEVEREKEAMAAIEGEPGMEAWGSSQLAEGHGWSREA